jgi:hypothetical protein
MAAAPTAPGPSSPIWRGEFDLLRLLDNPARRQASAVNAAVAAYGQGHTHLIRVDAHSLYPDDFVDVLLAEALATRAASVVVGMIAGG